MGCVLQNRHSLNLIDLTRAKGKSIKLSQAQNVQSRMFSNQELLDPAKWDQWAFVRQIRFSTASRGLAFWRLLLKNPWVIMVPLIRTLCERLKWEKTAFDLIYREHTLTCNYPGTPFSSEWKFSNKHVSGIILIALNNCFWPPILGPLDERLNFPKV